MQEAIDFRPLSRGDLKLLHEWLRREHVRRWWSGLETYEEVEAKYLPALEGRDPTDYYVILLDDRPIGMIQTYMAADYADTWPVAAGPDVAGVDLFIAADELLGRGLGPRILREFVREIVFANPRTVACVAGPDVRNHASIRAFEKAGFVRAGIVQVPGEDAPEQLLRLERPEAGGRRARR
jgi:RimJ/RimL family protein N-acetyltransferase